MSADMVLQDKRPTGKRGVQWRPAWAFKGATHDFLSEVLKDAPRPLVHVCCGPSRIPYEETRVDLEHPSADLNIDACDLDKHLQNVGTVFMDPPYAWDLPTRQKALSAAFRAMRPGGWLALHAPWTPRLPGASNVGLWWRDDPRFNWPFPPVLLSIWVKDYAAGDDLAKHEAEKARRAGKEAGVKP